MNEQINTFANMLEAGVARLRDPELTLEDKQKTLTVMASLSNHLAGQINTHIELTQGDSNA